MRENSSQQRDYQAKLTTLEDSNAVETYLTANFAAKTDKQSILQWSEVEEKLWTALHSNEGKTFKKLIMQLVRTNSTVTRTQQLRVTGKQEGNLRSIAELECDTTDQATLSSMIDDKMS
jgi:uncharacterized protein YajQ (UPF0234 family)